MDVWILLLVGGAAAGLFGSLLGLGGGILLVPFLTLVVGLPLREAVGVSLVVVIASSGTAAAVFLERKVADLRLGMSLELFSAAGALVGALVAFLISEQLLAAAFASLLVYSAISMLRPGRAVPAATSEPSGGYEIRNVGRGKVASVGAGMVAALLGVGGGLINVPVMHLAMGVPFRVATATSNMMIGVTASAAAVVYLARGGIDPYVAGPVALAVFGGASIGARVADRIEVGHLRIVFVGVLLFGAILMIRRALGVA